MINVFPYLLDYHQVAPLLLRTVLGILFINLGYLELTHEKNRWLTVFEAIRFKPAEFWTKFFGGLEIIGGIMLIVGFLTQAAALFFSIVSLAEIYIEYREPVLLRRNIVFYIVIFTISLSLLFSGAGLHAFDLPL